MNESRAAEGPPHSQVKGEPVLATGWFADAKADPDLGVRGAALTRLYSVFEARGNLTAGELGKGLPFAPRRFFVISKVPDEHIRGEHAHRTLHQFLVCLAGSVRAEVDDGKRRRSVVLDCPEVGLYIAPMVWGVQHSYSADAVLLVLASREYDPADYIREYDRFLALCGSR
jgi:UDP-2-acetamido-3-amino-2,3-dideoxy-glucuronate N-acetyltransferase